MDSSCPTSKHPNPDTSYVNFKVATTHKRPMDLLHYLYKVGKDLVAS
jgi:hypothetical protein